MRTKILAVYLIVVATLGVGTAGAQYDCSGLPTSTGPPPQELFDYCWVGPGPAIGADYPGDLAFGPEMVNAMFVDFALNAPEVLNVINSFDTTNFTNGCDFALDDFSKLYCADYANEFFSIDTTTGARTVIGPLTPPPPGGENVTGLTFTWSHGGTMFMVTSDGATSSLMTVDLTGATTYIGPITGAAAMIAVAADPAGNLFGYSISGDDFWSIDPVTGAGTLIGPLGFDASFGQGMDFDDSDGTCYLFAFNNDLYQPELRICDPSDGSSTLVGVIGVTSHGTPTQIPAAGIRAKLCDIFCDGFESGDTSAWQ